MQQAITFFTNRVINWRDAIILGNLEFRLSYDSLYAQKLNQKFLNNNFIAFSPKANNSATINCYSKNWGSNDPDKVFTDTVFNENNFKFFLGSLKANKTGC